MAQTRSATKGVVRRARENHAKKEAGALFKDELQHLGRGRKIGLVNERAGVKRHQGGSKKRMHAGGFKNFGWNQIRGDRGGEGGEKRVNLFEKKKGGIN